MRAWQEGNILGLSVAGGVKPGSVIEIEQRLYQQLILGKQRIDSGDDELEPELEAVAFKLEVEREATLERLARQQQAKALYQRVSAQLTDTLAAELGNRLASIEEVTRLSGITDKQILLLELLQHPRLDLARLRPVVAEQNWLVRDLSSLVNSPSFRARRPQNLDVQLTDLKLVLSYIGVEHLRVLIPYYTCRHWLPTGHASLLWTVRKLWRFSQVQGIAARTLAKLHDLDAPMLYAVSLMQQLGISVLLSMSAKLFEQLRGSWLREASSDRDKALYDAIALCDFPAALVYSLVKQHALSLNWQLPTQLGFADAAMVTLLKERDTALGFSQLSPNAAVLAKADCFAKCFLLEEMRQLEFRDRRIMMAYHELTEQELIRLKGQNYRKPELL